jgi:hypothetical protein
MGYVVINALLVAVRAIIGRVGFRRDTTSTGVSDKAVGGVSPDM